MPERVTIPVSPRTVVGKGVSRLRRNGVLPANVFGRGIESLAIELDAHGFGRTLKSHGVIGLFDLDVEGESQSRPVVIRAISRRGGTGEPVHVDFYQVDPNRPIQSTAQIRLTGEAPAVRDLAGTLLVTMETVAIRCKPLAIPDALEASLLKLTAFDVSLNVGDITVPDGVEILTDPSVVIATVAAPRIRTEDEEEAAAAAEAAEAEAAAEEPAEEASDS
jgi:large subunit ribosomal protein L25